MTDNLVEPHLVVGLPNHGAWTASAPNIQNIPKPTFEHGLKEAYEEVQRPVEGSPSREDLLRLEERLKPHADFGQALSFPDGIPEFIAPAWERHLNDTAIPEFLRPKDPENPYPSLMGLRFSDQFFSKDSFKYSQVLTPPMDPTHGMSFESFGRLRGPDLTALELPDAAYSGGGKRIPIIRARLEARRRQLERKRWWAAFTASLPAVLWETAADIGAVIAILAAAILSVGGLVTLATWLRGVFG